MKYLKYEEYKSKKRKSLKQMIKLFRSGQSLCHLINKMRNFCRLIYNGLAPNFVNLSGLYCLAMLIAVMLILWSYQDIQTTLFLVADIA